jgi:hypothetical protein
MTSEGSLFHRPSHEVAESDLTKISPVIQQKSFLLILACLRGCYVWSSWYSW